MRHDLAVSLLVAIGVAATGRGIWIVAELWGATASVGHWLDDVLTGVITGIAMFVLLRVLASRRAATLKRLHDIREMNHHVRNALQVIRTAHFATEGNEWVKVVAEAADRIEFALREFNV